VLNPLHNTSIGTIILSAAYDATHNANRLVKHHFNLRLSHLCNLYAADDNAAVLLPIFAIIVSTIPTTAHTFLLVVTHHLSPHLNPLICRQKLQRTSQQPNHHCFQAANPLNNQHLSRLAQPSDRPLNDLTAIPCMQPSSQPSDSPNLDPPLQPTNQLHWSQKLNQRPSQRNKEYLAQLTNQATNRPIYHIFDHHINLLLLRLMHHPSQQPPNRPNYQPMMVQTMQPSIQPTKSQMSAPITQPSSSPTSQPSVQPTKQPSRIPQCFPADSLFLSHLVNRQSTNC
jgi:hypothetical protein